MPSQRCDEHAPYDHTPDDLDADWFGRRALNADTAPESCAAAARVLRGAAAAVVWVAARGRAKSFWESCGGAAVTGVRRAVSALETRLVRAGIGCVVTGDCWELACASGREL
jgi:hypothetical protein